MIPPQQQDITRLLVGLSNGDQIALDKLLPLVYDELRQLAERALPNNSKWTHTLVFFVVYGH